MSLVSAGRRIGGSHVVGTGPDGVAVVVAVAVGGGDGVTPSPAASRAAASSPLGAGLFNPGVQRGMRAGLGHRRNAGR